MALVLKKMPETALIRQLLGLVTIILNAEYSASGDVNQDGTNNIVDIISLVNIVLGEE